MISGFELNFSFQFHRPSTCGVPPHPPAAADAADAAGGAGGAGGAAPHVAAAVGAQGEIIDEIIDEAEAMEAEAVASGGGGGGRTEATGGGYGRRLQAEAPGGGYGQGAAGGGGGGGGDCATPGVGARDDPRSYRGAVGGEGLALLLHSDPRGLEARGCGGAGVGYAREGSYFGECEEHIGRSVAVQLVAHQNVSQPLQGKVNVGGLDIAQDSVVWGAEGEMGVYLDGDNGAALAAARWNARGGTLLDGAAHHVRVSYTVVTGHSWLHLFLDHETYPALALPLSLSDAGVLDEAGMAWVGFTASTGVASMDADLLSFAFTQYPGA